MVRVWLGGRAAVAAAVAVLLLVASAATLLQDDLPGRTLSTTFLAALDATRTCLLLWMRVIGILMVHGFRLLSIYVWPVVKSLSQMTVDWIRESDPLFILFLSVLASLAVVAYLLTRFVKKRRYVPRALEWVDSKARRVSRFKRRVMEDIAQKSLVVAAALPHVLYAAFAVSMLYAFPERMARLTNNGELFFVSVFFPALLSTRAASVHQASTARVEHCTARVEAAATAAAAAGGGASDDQGPSTPVTKASSWMNLLRTPLTWRRSSLPAASPSPAVAERRPSFPGFAGDTDDARADLEVARMLYADAKRSVRHWISYWCVYSSFLLLSRVVPVRIPLVSEGEVALFVCLWLQLRWTEGALIALRAVVWAGQFVPMIGRFLADVPSAEGVAARSSGLLNLLVTLRMIRQPTADWLMLVFKEGGLALLLSAVFFVTPGFVTAYGCVLAGLAFPVHSSLQALRSDADVAQHRWLVYWISYSVLSFLHLRTSVALGGFPFWYHAELLACLWLQLPGLRGADRIFVRLTGFWASSPPVPPPSPASAPAPGASAAPAAPATPGPSAAQSGAGRADGKENGVHLSLLSVPGPDDPMVCVSRNDREAQVEPEEDDENSLGLAEPVIVRRRSQRRSQS